MYKIVNVKDGSVIGNVETPNYIKKKPSTGCYVNANTKTAQGISYQGKAYNLQGKESLGAEDTVILVQFDIGELVSQTNENSKAIDDIIISMLGG